MAQIQRERPRMLLQASLLRLSLAVLALHLSSCAVNDYLVRQRMMDHPFRDRISPPLKQGMERKLRELHEPVRKALPAPPWLDRG